MKTFTIYKIICILLVTFITAGCNKFLDEVEPQGQEPSTGFMNTEENAEQAVIALYNMLSFVSGNGPDGDWIDNHYEWYMGSVASDDADKGSEPSDYMDLQLLAQYQVNSTNSFVRNFYINGFWGVSRANYILANIEDASINAQVKQRIKGEGHFFRAYWYLYLLQHYGGMPILRDPVKASDFGNVPRSSYTETIQFILDEFKLAADLLPKREDYLPKDLGRASKGAAQGLRARVMLYRLGTDPEVGSSETSWQALYDLTGEIIRGDYGTYSLMPNYATLFDEITDGNYRTESLFEYTGKDGWLNSGIALMYFYVQGARPAVGWGFNQPNEDLRQAFDPTDPRLSSTIYGVGFNNGILFGVTQSYNRNDQMMTNYYNRKAAITGIDALLWGTTKAVIIIRYADILLMRAEAAYYTNQESEARNRVNEVRDRARQSSYCKGYGLGDPNGFVFPGITPNIPVCSSSGQALLEDIWHERRVELAMENFRTYDLIRTGRLLDRVEAVKDINRNPSSPTHLTINDANKEARILGIRQNIIKSSIHVTIPGQSGGERYIPVFPIPPTEITYWNLEGNPNN